MPGIVITGGTKGIGRSLVMKFAKEGFDIVTCARSKKDLDELKTTIQNNYPLIKIHAFACDVSKKDEIMSFGDRVIDESGIPDILINNAGIFLPGKIQDEEAGIFEAQVNTNMASAYHLTRKILPGMISRKSGYIINMCSTASAMAYPNGGSYTISKFALLGFTKALREELKEHHIRVSAVLPGATLTDSWKGTDLPADKFMDPDALAELIFTFCQSPQTMVVEEIIIRPLQGDVN